MFYRTISRISLFQCTEVRSLIGHCHEFEPSKTVGMILRDDIIASASANRAQQGQILADKLI